MPKRKRTPKNPNNDPKNTSQKTKDLTTQTLQIHGRVSSSYYTSITRRGTLFKNSVRSHKRIKENNGIEATTNGASL
jgi:hypothetical protein